MQMTNKLGLNFVFMIEKWEEDRLHEIEENIQNAFFYTAYNFDEETNLINFYKIFNHEFTNIQQVEDFLKKEAKIERQVLIIKNIEHLISKTNKTVIDFLTNIKNIYNSNR